MIDLIVNRLGRLRPSSENSGDAVAGRGACLQEDRPEATSEGSLKRQRQFVADLNWADLLLRLFWRKAESGHQIRAQSCLSHLAQIVRESLNQFYGILASLDALDVNTTHAGHTSERLLTTQVNRMIHCSCGPIRQFP